MLKDEIFVLLEQLNKTRTDGGARKIIKKINKLVHPVIRQIIDILEKYCIKDEGIGYYFGVERGKDVLSSNTSTIWYEYDERLNILEVTYEYGCFGEIIHDFLYIPMIAFEDMETVELNFKFERSKKLQKDIRDNSCILTSLINEWNGDEHELQWYKTHDVLYLDAKDDKYKMIQAWPSYSDNGDIIWTKCDDNDTVLSNSRVTFYLLNR